MWRYAPRSPITLPTNCSSRSSSKSSLNIVAAFPQLDWTAATIAMLTFTPVASGCHLTVTARRNGLTAAARSPGSSRPRCSRSVSTCGSRCQRSSSLAALRGSRGRWRSSATGTPLGSRSARTLRPHPRERAAADRWRPRTRWLSRPAVARHRAHPLIALVRRHGGDFATTWPKNPLETGPMNATRSNRSTAEASPTGPGLPQWSTHRPLETDAPTAAPTRNNGYVPAVLPRTPVPPGLQATPKGQLCWSSWLVGASEPGDMAGLEPSGVATSRIEVQGSSRRRPVVGDAD